jgi:type II secretory pathway pseudopilin PulG
MSEATAIEANTTVRESERLPASLVTRLLTAIVIILAGVLATNVYMIITTAQQNKVQEQRAAEYQERVEAARLVLDSQREIIFGLLSEYEDAAYNNPRLDRIAEQQLIAAEYQLTVLQILAIQNSQIIELLAEAP